MTLPQTTQQLQNLRAHVKDWKGHSLDTLGPLYLHETLTVRRGSQTKEYVVHVFESALIFIAEEPDSRTLNVKGRLFIKNIAEATKFVSPEETQIVISMQDEREDLAVHLLFRAEDKPDVWGDLILLLAVRARTTPASSEPVTAAVLSQQSARGRAESKPTETDGKTHNIFQENLSDIESQTVEEKTQQDGTKVGHSRWGMVIMLFACLTLQGLFVTYLVAQGTFIENDSS